jgi:hypothetical protein
VFAPAPAEEPETLAFALLRSADSDVIERPHPESVDGEAPAADVATDFAEGVELGLPVRGDTEHPNPILIGGSVQPDRAGWGGRRCHHPILPTTPTIRRKGATGGNLEQNSGMSEKGASPHELPDCVPVDRGDPDVFLGGEDHLSV